MYKFILMDKDKPICNFVVEGGVTKITNLQGDWITDDSVAKNLVDYILKGRDGEPSFPYHASLRDSFWIKEECSKEEWKELNPFIRAAITTAPDFGPIIAENDYYSWVSICGVPYLIAKELGEYELESLYLSSLIAKILSSEGGISHEPIVIFSGEAYSSISLEIGDCFTPMIKVDNMQSAISELKIQGKKLLDGISLMAIFNYITMQPKFDRYRVGVVVNELGERSLSSLRNSKDLIKASLKGGLITEEEQQLQEDLESINLSRYVNLLKKLKGYLNNLNIIGILNNVKDFSSIEFTLRFLMERVTALLELEMYRKENPIIPFYEDWKELPDGGPYNMSGPDYVGEDNGLYDFEKGNNYRRSTFGARGLVSFGCNCTKDRFHSYYDRDLKAFICLICKDINYVEPKQIKCSRCKKEYTEYTWFDPNSCPSCRISRVD